MRNHWKIALSKQESNTSSSSSSSSSSLTTTSLTKPSLPSSSHQKKRARRNLSLDHHLFQGDRNNPDDVVRFLMQITKLSKPVVLHALIVNTGSVLTAYDYLMYNGPLDAKKKFKCWDPAEDRLIMNEDWSRTLIQQRGIDAVKRRVAFLEP
eukprot:CAMPEP_0201549248 /NCGR_PEP_ID=MMETSP0173_2-20130828/5740_1 /ASSEMBLY_ACC=CAM_ASM_000268 /TAXON_ID=218659 /ORGANISM="Vexillifera sp., Strain DIVA3 564/2" /LENGTH=151 /DNA_ID=CAMNT_0047958861 /DNA_START=278 /DNA_END=733 /DNA_ORIENTATION=+